LFFDIFQPGNVPLEQHDPEMFDLIEKEKNRQWKSLELIASEVSIVFLPLHLILSCFVNENAFA
jgi:glycine hydroxymethyltransferase